MLHDLGKVKEVNILNDSDTVINPATEEKLNEIKSVLDTIQTNTDELELKAENVHLNTDQLEAISAEIRDTIGQETGATVLSKLEAVVDKLEALFNDPATGKVIIHDGEDVADVTDEGRLQVDARIGGAGTDRSALISAFGMMKVAQEAMLGNIRYSTDVINQEFDVDTINTGSLGNWSIVDTSCLQVNSGASSNSGVNISSKIRYHYQSGRGQMFKVSIVLGDSGVEGNVREWGMGDGTNGVFIRLNGTQYEFVLLNDGVETVVPASSWDLATGESPVTPDDKGHLWYIQFQWLGVGDYFVYYDGALVYSHNYLGTATKVSMEDPDLPVWFRNYNTTNTTDVYFKTGCASVITEGANIISGLDEDNIIREARVTATGRLLVSQEPPTAPPDTTSVKKYAYSNMSGTVDTEYIIPSGETLILQRLQAGAEDDSPQGSIIELWYDPGATGTGEGDWQLIDVIFASGQSDQHDLNDQFTGDGEAKIIMRRKRLSGEAKWIYGKWEGYY